jgi:hypothetical protein
MSREGDVPIVCSLQEHCSDVGMVCNKANRHCEPPSTGPHDIVNDPLQQKVQPIKETWEGALKGMIHGVPRVGISALYNTEKRAIISSITIIILAFLVAYMH